MVSGVTKWPCALTDDEPKEPGGFPRLVGRRLRMVPIPVYFLWILYCRVYSADILS